MCYRCEDHIVELEVERTISILLAQYFLKLRVDHSGSTSHSKVQSCMVYTIHHAMKNMPGEKSVSRLGYFTPGENTVPSGHPIEG